MITTRATKWISTAAFLLAAASLEGGCTAEVQAVPVYPAAEVEVVPPEVEASPYVIYEGRPVHYYGGHWYFQNGAHWSYYQSEPPALYRQRPYVQQAPPARRAHPEPNDAPPAERVR